MDVHHPRLPVLESTTSMIQPWNFRENRAPPTPAVAVTHAPSTWCEINYPICRCSHAKSRSYVFLVRSPASSNSPTGQANGGRRQMPKRKQKDDIGTSNLFGRSAGLCIGLDCGGGFGLPFLVPLRQCRPSLDNVLAAPFHPRLIKRLIGLTIRAHDIE